MAAKPGNTQAKKLTTDELKRLAFESYCKHIATGRSKKSWTFKHADLMLTWQTMETYIKNEPDVFNSLQIEMAEADSLQVWEDHGNQLLKGGYKGGSPAIWQITMRNKFGWDRKDGLEHGLELVEQLGDAMQYISSLQGKKDK